MGDARSSIGATKSGRGAGGAHWFCRTEKGAANLSGKNKKKEGRTGQDQPGGRASNTVIQKDGQKTDRSRGKKKGGEGGHPGRRRTPKLSSSPKRGESPFDRGANPAP